MVNWLKKLLNHSPVQPVTKNVEGGSYSHDHSIKDVKTPNAEHVEIKFRVPEGDEIYIENLWAVNLGNDHYKIDNIPVHAYSVSCGDVVEAIAVGDGMPTFVEVIEKSGNETTRIDFDCHGGDVHGPQTILDALLSKGCSFENWTEDNVSIHIPKGIGWKPIVEYLIEMDVDWDYADPSHEDIYGKDQGV